MNVPYFTVLHWLDLLFFLLLFIFLVIVSIKASGSNAKIALSMIFASFLVSAFGGVLGIVILEKYTKQARIIDLKQRRVLLNETLVLKGRIKNVGDYKINYCKLKIKLVNNAYGSKLKKGSLFKSGGLNIFGSKDKNVKPNTIEVTRVIVRKLEPGIMKNFSVVMPYPPYFKDTYLNTKLYCH